MMPLIAFKARIRTPAHALVASAAFCHRQFFPCDIMHLLDSKGVASMVFGSALMWLLTCPRLGPNRDDRLREINERRVVHYDGRPGVQRLPKLTLHNVTRDGWGNLSGPAYKAAVTLHASPFFRELVCSTYTSERPRDVCLRALVTSLDELYSLLYGGPMFLPEADLARVRGLVEEFGVQYQRMRELSRRAGILAFAVTPKVHKVQHLPALAATINPAAVQVYAEESLMGSVTKTWRGSARGRYREHVQTVVLVKRVTALLLRFELAL